MMLALTHKRSLTALGLGLCLALGGFSAAARAQADAQPEIPLEPLLDLPKVPPPPKKKPKAPKKKTAPAPWLTGKKKGPGDPAAQTTPLPPARPTAPLIAAPPGKGPAQAQAPVPAKDQPAAQAQKSSPQAPDAPDAEPPPPLLIPAAPPAVAGKQPAPLPSDAPPLLKLSTSIGVIVSGLEAAQAARVESGLRAIADLAPLSAAPVSLNHPAGACEDDACLTGLGAKQQVDEVLAATFADGLLRVRAVDVRSRAQIGDGEVRAPSGLLEETAAAEALACKIIVPAGCTGEVAVDADSADTKLELDGAALPRATRRKLPVGLHALKARLGSRTAERPLPVLRESPPGPTLTARMSGQELQLLTPADLQVRAPAAALVGEPASRGSRAGRIVGIGTLSAGAVVALAAVFEGAHSRSQISQAETAYHQHGGAYLQTDLAALQSGNSAAHTANVLFAVSGVLAAAGLVVTLAF